MAGALLLADDPLAGLALLEPAAHPGLKRAEPELLLELSLSRDLEDAVDTERNLEVQTGVRGLDELAEAHHHPDLLGFHGVERREGQHQQQQQEPVQGFTSLMPGT